MDYKKVSDHIVNWIIRDMKESHVDGCVVGVSGGIDSAVVSNLCARTYKPVICAHMPINQDILPRAEAHVEKLKKDYTNVTSHTEDLSVVFNNFNHSNYYNEFAMVNTRSRLRMVALYAIANTHNYYVVGTGNMVEDFGIGFFTKFGDGGVDISPIGELVKSEVYGMGAYLGVNSDILTAKPTDGLWEDGRTDEDQIGATYSELEWAMDFCKKLGGLKTIKGLEAMKSMLTIEKRKMKVLELYLERHEKNAHKMEMPRICHLDI